MRLTVIGLPASGTIIGPRGGGPGRALFYYGSGNSRRCRAPNDYFGKYFTDSKGMTLYVFKKDSPGKSVCAGPCVVKWPLYFRETVAVPEGLQAGDFGTITREDGKKQTTYKG
ncbi:MAG: hypothetical protein WBN64_12190 [Candidatus Deferrimicrobium sp.]